MMGDVRPEHQAIIERLQPYKRGGQGKGNRLYRLSEINNADQHRLLQVVGVTPMSRSWGYWDDPALSGAVVETLSPFHVRWFNNARGVRKLQDGAKFAESSDSVHVGPNITPLTAFGEGCRAVEDRPVVIVLDRIAKHVSEVVEGFGLDFS